MRNLFIFVLFFFVTIAHACDCELPNSAIEFYNAAYVFEGTVTSKTYAQDFQNYTVTFCISKHYKKGAKPATLSFVLPAEEAYTNRSTSCDWTVNVGEKWLVYAHKGEDKIVHFNEICSNSRRVDQNPISEVEQEKLNNGNTFDIGDYIYFQEHGFTNPDPITNIDSIFQNAKKDNYKNTFTIIKLYINKKGELQSVSNSKQFNVIYDAIFKLPKQFIARKATPSNNFEKEAFRLSERMKKWGVKYHKKTKTPVAYIKTIIFQYDKKSNTWSYEL